MFLPFRNLKYCQRLSATGGGYCGNGSLRRNRYVRLGVLVSFLDCNCCIRFEKKIEIGKQIGYLED